jgi:5'(3')-deoxyribonucleotidase
MTDVNKRFVFGVDLDGVVADFYERIREIAAEWKGVPVESLTPNVQYGLPEWDLVPGEYNRIHRFAVTQRDLFATMKPIKGAPQSIRRLGTEGVRIRIVTYRLFTGVRHFHQTAVAQTVKWLDANGIPYWDLCFMRDKGEVAADVYIEDTPHNIKDLREGERPVIVFSNSTNLDVPDEPGGRANGWAEAEEMVRARYYDWLDKRGLARPPAPGHEPPWAS